MKKYIILHFLVFVAFVSNAQVLDIAMPSAVEKTALKQVLSQYETFVSYMGGDASADAKKAESIKFMREVLAKGTNYVVNDCDTTKLEKINFLLYMNKVAGAYGANTKHAIVPSSVVFSNIKYDQWRRFFYTEVKVNKMISWKEIVSSKKVVIDSIGKVVVDSVVVSDTLIKSKTFKLSFFIRFERDNTTSKNFKLFGIMPPGEMPTLEPLGALQQWWSGLDVEWKATFNKWRKLDDYPTEFDLEKLTYLSELDFTDAKMSNYEPLSQFTNVSKLLLNGASINTFEPISKMTRLRYLDISKSKIESIEGVQNLTRLEEFYCVGNKLKSIAPISTNINLLKFNCSENDLEDISAVKDLINLKDLNVSLNIKVKNIDAVKSLVNMEKISFRKIEIKDLTPVQAMINLVYLDAYNTGVVSLEPIRNMQKIYHLDLSSNKLTSLDPIRNYRFLVNLYLNTSSVADYDVIDNFTHLHVLDIANCPQIKSLGGIHKLNFLTSLKCYYTSISKNEVARFMKNHPKCGVTYY